MRSAKSAWTACVLALVLNVQWACAQPLPQSPPQSTQDALHAMSQQAAVIFAGQVTGVRRNDGVTGTIGVVEIDFAVEDAIRGVIGGTYTLREWAGLWPTGEAPFSIGQHYLMLLNAPGPSGLSSPVGGMDGAIPVRGSSPPPRSQATPSLTSQTVAGSTPSDGRVVDLRWIGTMLVRPVAYRSASVVRQPVLPVSVHAYAVTRLPATVQEPETSLASQPADVSASTTPVQAAAELTDDSASQFTSYPAMLAILRAWEKSDHAAR